MRKKMLFNGNQVNCHFYRIFETYKMIIANSAVLAIIIIVKCYSYPVLSAT